MTKDNHEHLRRYDQFSFLGATCFPPGPLHHDKLANSEPFARAKDLENELTKLALDGGEDVKKILHIKTKGKKSELGSSQRWEKELRESVRLAISQSAEGEKMMGWYNNRIGEMGEFAFMEAVKAACKEIPGHPVLIITAYDVHKNLWERKGDRKSKIDGALKGMKIDFKDFKNHEHDTLIVIPNGDKIDVLCCQTKVVQHGDVKELQKKVDQSIQQALTDVLAFLAILPDLTPDQIAKINFKLFSVLPATSGRTLPEGIECKKHIIFREDIRPGADQNPVSLAED